jgi:hypothetical protein
LRIKDSDPQLSTDEAVLKKIQEIYYLSKKASELWNKPFVRGAAPITPGKLPVIKRP